MAGGKSLYIRNIYENYDEWNISSYNSKQDIIMNSKINTINSNGKNKAQRITNKTEIEEIVEE